MTPILSITFTQLVLKQYSIIVVSSSTVTSNVCSVLESETHMHYLQARPEMYKDRHLEIRTSEVNLNSFAFFV